MPDTRSVWAYGEVSPQARMIVALGAGAPVLAILWGTAFGHWPVDVVTFGTVFLIAAMPLLARRRTRFETLCLVAAVMLIPLTVLGVFFVLFTHLPLVAIELFARGVSRRPESRILALAGTGLAALTLTCWWCAILYSRL